MTKYKYTYTAKQKAAHVELWVKALRSGKYKQITGRLKRDGGFCCLGVACEISGLGKWQRGGYNVDGGSNAVVLPPAVQKWLGLHSKSGFQYSLATLNDNKEYDFNKIADVIESKGF